MAAITTPHSTAGGERRGTLRFLVGELKPKGKLLTPFNLISLPVMLVAAGILVIRFTEGLGAVTNLSDAYPWGIWKAFNVIAGVAFAGGAYVLCFMVYVLGLKKYRPIVRITVLNGFLAYCFYAGALILELGRPWEIFNPIIGNGFGFSSVLFLVAWHFVLYIMAAFIEFSPAVAEWVGAKRAHRVLEAMTLGAVILGISLSLLHQSGLGALFLMAGPKIHPLWFTEFIPILFVVSSIFAGLAVVIAEGSLTDRAFAGVSDDAHKGPHKGILVGLARICAGTMVVYLVLQLLHLVHSQTIPLLGTTMGVLWLVEVVGLTLLPCLLFLAGMRSRGVATIRVASVLTILGILLNRLNVSLIAYRWDDPNHYVPTWMEVVVAIAIIFAQIWVFRWIILRMPVLRRGPDWAREHGSEPEGSRFTGTHGD